MIVTEPCQILCYTLIPVVIACIGSLPILCLSSDYTNTSAISVLYGGLVVNADVGLQLLSSLSVIVALSLGLAVFADTLYVSQSLEHQVKLFYLALAAPDPALESNF